MENAQEVINNLTMNIGQGNQRDQIIENFDVITNVIVGTRDIVEATNISLPSLINVGIHCTWSRTTLVLANLHLYHLTACRFS